MLPEDDSLFIPARTGTHADALAAVGLADLLQACGGRARIESVPGGYCVSSGGGSIAALLQNAPSAPGYSYLRPNEKSGFPEEVAAVDRFDYPALKQAEDQKKKLREPLIKERQKLRQKGQGSAELDELISQVARRTDWRRWESYNLLQGDETGNRVFLKYLEIDRTTLPDVLLAGIESLGGEKEPPSWGATAVQLFTPSWAKGYARLKPDSTDRNGGLDRSWVNSFEEWLKYRGYFHVACPYRTGSKGEHIRLICPIPANISLPALSAVCQELLSRSVYGSDPRVDILSVLGIARILIEHATEEADDGPFADLGFSGFSPADLISGVHVTFYQSLGQARSVSAMSTLAMPGWFPVATAEDAALWKEILDEHSAIVRGLKDDHSDEIGLLVQYRRFLEKRQGTALLELLDFLGAYGALVLRAASQQRRLRRPLTTHLRRLIEAMTGQYSAILGDPGFEAIAAAIRRATLSAQAQKSMGHDYREIRYDLLPELRRKRSVPGGAFLEVVADFVSLYNAENGKRREQKKPAPKNVTTEQFAAFARLLDENDVPLVGSLLCAYATCREPREEPIAAEDGSSATSVDSIDSEGELQ